MAVQEPVAIHQVYLHILASFKLGLSTFVVIARLFLPLRAGVTACTVECTGHLSL